MNLPLSFCPTDYKWINDNAHKANPNNFYYSHLALKEPPHPLTMPPLTQQLLHLDMSPVENPPAVSDRGAQSSSEVVERTVAAAKPLRKRPKMTRRAKAGERANIQVLWDEVLKTRERAHVEGSKNMLDNIAAIVQRYNETMDLDSIRRDMKIDLSYRRFNKIFKMVTTYCGNKSNSNVDLADYVIKDERTVKKILKKSKIFDLSPFIKMVCRSYKQQHPDAYPSLETKGVSTTDLIRISTQVEDLYREYCASSKEFDQFISDLPAERLQSLFRETKPYEVTRGS